MTAPYVPLGSTALKVSRLGLGTMSFGPRTSREDAISILDEALERGINFIDTADSYGRRAETGGEELLGDWLAAAPGRRDRVVLATKVCAPVGDGPNDRGLSAKHIRLACEASLKRLKTDYIDLYQMHHIDRAAPWEEIWQAMGQLQAAGKVLYVGSSNFAGWHIAAASEAARRWQRLGLVTEQSTYSLAKRMIELEVIPACRSYGMSVLAYSPLGGGVLAVPPSEVAGPRTRRDSVHSRQLLGDCRAAVEAFHGLCHQRGVAAARVALAWVLGRGSHIIPVIGPRTREHLQVALDALANPLDEDWQTRLSELFPGPGGEAPEAYAW